MTNSADERDADALAGEPFISRWSRRKRDARRTQDGLPAVREQPEEVPEEAPVELTDADMPALESLDESSDFSGFMAPKVSEKLRRMALRKLFHLPGFNITDGLDDYDEDFRNFEALGDVITADMRHQAEMEAERTRQAAADAAQSPVSAEQTAGTVRQESESPAATTGPASDPVAVADDAAEDDAAGEDAAGEDAAGEDVEGDDELA